MLVVGRSPADMNDRLSRACASGRIFSVTGLDRHILATSVACRFVVAKDHREIREVSWALALRERAELLGGYLVELDDRILNGSQ
jgi:hypothetical protein